MSFSKLCFEGGNGHFPLKGVSSVLFQALFLCSICVVFWPVLVFGNLFLSTLTWTNATDFTNIPRFFADFASSRVLVSFIAFIFSKKLPFFTLRGLFKRLTAPSQSQKGPFLLQNECLMNDTKTPGTDKSPLNP